MPLLRDPIFRGAADPVVICNKKEQKWFMFYSKNSAKAKSMNGVSWIHGTRIGIAKSFDGGASWNYRDPCVIQYRLTDYTHWAPEVIKNDGVYHMYLTYVPGVFTDWNHPAWNRQEKNILPESGSGEDDKVMGGHADVLVNNGRVFIFYVTHPGRIPEKKGKNGVHMRRSSIQVAELKYVDGQIVCDRDQPVRINRNPPEKINCKSQIYNE